MVEKLKHVASYYSIHIKIENEHMWLTDIWYITSLIGRRSSGVSQSLNRASVNVPQISLRFSFHMPTVYFSLIIPPFHVVITWQLR
jgi:hypothetical protein